MLGRVLSSKDFGFRRGNTLPHGEASGGTWMGRVPQAKGCCPAEALGLAHPDPQVLVSSLLPFVLPFSSHCQPSPHLSLLLQELIKMLSIQTPVHLGKTFCHLSSKCWETWFFFFLKKMDFYGEGNNNGRSLLGMMRSEFLDQRHWQEAKLGKKLRSRGTLIT